MQYSLLLNLRKAHEWGLSLPQATLFAFLYELPSWAEAELVDGQSYWRIAKSKISRELPILSEKPDTIYRYLLALEDAGLINRVVRGNTTLIRITEKGASWNRQGSDLNPRSGEGSDLNPSGVGFKSEQGSDLNPSNHITSDPITNIKEPPVPVSEETNSGGLFPEGDKPPKGNHVLKTYLAYCKRNNLKAVPKDDPVFHYAESVKLPLDFLLLCWREFVDRHVDGEKRYKSWLKAFRNCVRDNWYGLWFIDGEGYKLTTKGRQAELRHKNRAPE